MTLSAMGGLMAVTGEPHREPLQQGSHQMQYQAGLNAAVATLTALWARGSMSMWRSWSVPCPSRRCTTCVISTPERIPNVLAIARH